MSIVDKHFEKADKEVQLRKYPKNHSRPFRNNRLF